VPKLKNSAVCAIFSAVKEAAKKVFRDKKFPVQLRT
jgi:hypothetical protein